jgi:DNA-directed RNA polymerase subunit RPC12/RpoP
MFQKQSSAFCPHCERRVLTLGTAPNHVLHLILTFFTVGLWGFIWLAVALGKIGGYRCSKCGTPV